MRRPMFSVSLFVGGTVLAVLTSSPVAAAEALPATPVISLDGQWLLATDPENVGRERGWPKQPVAEATPAKVPWIIQDAFPGYHGVAWYWRDFAAPAPSSAGGRYLLRFWAVDYLAEVWLNGVHVGGHEGGETPFVLDVTEAVRPGRQNRLAVRVLNPTNEPIDGIVLAETPRRCKVIPYSAGAGFNHGGIVDSVELLLVPPVRVENLFVRPDAQTGKIRVEVNVRNAKDAAAGGRLELSVAPASSGTTRDAVRLEREFPPGDTCVRTELQVDDPHLWDLNDPYLYRVTARVQPEKHRSFSEQSTCCGFRDFRFAGGYFRLNGRRIYLRSTHTCNHYPIGLQFPHDPDLLRRDLLNLKVMGFNAVRFIWGGAARVQLDLCDEIGLLVYEESFASSPIADCPKMGERFDRSVAELIRRDRNHASVVIWGLLNEARDGPAFRHAVAMLPRIRELDDSRLVLLNSGRWDQADGVEQPASSIGSLSNPGSVEWEDLVDDRHFYPRVPHTAGTLHTLRTLEAGPKPVFLSEYGIGSAVDLWRATRHYEQLGAERLEDARFFRDKLDRFLTDFDQWQLADTFDRPEDFFAASLRKMASQRLLGLNAIRSNPNIVGHSLTGAIDHVMCGEGLTTLFRELKPGTIDAMFDAWAPLRFCLFAEPCHVYRGSSVHLEAVLANEDALAPGDYPARLLLIAPDGTRKLDRTVTITIPEDDEAPERPFATKCFEEDVIVDGPEGKYRLVAAFEEGAAASGGEVDFYVTDPAQMPPVENEIVLWGEDPGLAQWLTKQGIRWRRFSPEPPKAREAILAAGKPAGSAEAEAFGDLARRIARGSCVVFLVPEVLAKGDQPLGWLPLANQGTLAKIHGWLYLKDEWAKRHTIFDGLQAGGLMDYTFYREIIPDAVLSGQDPPAETVAGAIKASQDYSSGLMVALYNLGAGRILLNTLRIRENLGRHPAADRLLVNMLRYAGKDLQQPLAEP